MLGSNPILLRVQIAVTIALDQRRVHIIDECTESGVAELPALGRREEQIRVGSDIYVVVHWHAVQAATLRTSIDRVAQYRRIDLTPLHSVFAGYAEIGQQRWLA